MPRFGRDQDLASPADLIAAEVGTRIHRVRLARDTPLVEIESGGATT